MMYLKLFMQFLPIYTVTLFLIILWKIIHIKNNGEKIGEIKNHDLAIAIQMNYKAGMKAKAIADLFKITKQRVNYWLHHSIKKRIRRTKLTRNEIHKIVKWARDKPIIECRVSTKNI